MTIRMRSTLIVTVDSSLQDYREDGIELTLDRVAQRLIKGALPDVKVTYQLSSARIEVAADEKEETGTDSHAVFGVSPTND